MMYKTACLFLLLFANPTFADEAADSAAKHIPGELQDFTYKFKTDHFAHRPASEGGVVMFGDSLTDLGGWSEFFPGKKMINRGISGDNTFGMLKRADQVVALKPRVVFLLAGTNDLFWGGSPADIIVRYQQLLDYLQKNLPDAKLVLQTVPPLLKKPGGDYGYLDNTKTVALDDLIRQEAARRGLGLIDLYRLVAKDGQMNPDLTTDGIHLNGAGYEIWVEAIRPHIQ